jgi:hypothetical protein
MLRRKPFATNESGDYPGAADHLGGRPVLETQIIKKTLRVPTAAGTAGDGSAVALQVDSALLSAGFKASRELMAHLSGLHPVAATEIGRRIVEAVRELVGDHVEHNVYFRHFPAGVPNTVESWREVLAAALGRAQVPFTLPQLGLAYLPGYGSYQQTYQEMLALHDELAPALTDRITVLHLGQDLDTEARALYADLAGSRVPPGEQDAELLAVLAVWCLDGEQPAVIPIRENRALINRVRLANDRPLLIDTVTDVLRLACALSGGDVSLLTPTRFRSPARRDRRTLLAALDEVVAENPTKLADVAKHAEPWKRLGERLHPHEYPQWTHAARVFAVARGEQTVRSMASRVEEAFAQRDIPRAIGLLAKTPGLLARSLDWTLRLADAEEAKLATGALAEVADSVSGRVLLSLREHLMNRGKNYESRVFINRSGRARATGDWRPPLHPDAVADACATIDDSVARRLPAHEHLVVDPAVYELAVPLSAKTSMTGFGTVPRGSWTPVEGSRLRFFMHWRQQSRRTDLDLSALMLDDAFQPVGQLSYTSLFRIGGRHSGDITQAPDGASEFIDIRLSKVRARYIVPQVNVYAGEDFEQVAESCFGFMTLGEDQRGKPFEPSTVRMRSDLRGGGRVALPLAFVRFDDGSWWARWLHLYLRGDPWHNRVENNHVSASLLVRMAVERRSLTLRYLVDLLRAKANRFTEYEEGRTLDGPVTFVGLDRPAGLPAGSEVFVRDRLNSLAPA